MLKRTWIVAAFVLMAGCATSPAPSTSAASTSACEPLAEPRPVYLDIQDFQQALNNATRSLSGNWTIGIGPVFKRLDAVIAELDRTRGARERTCPGSAEAAELSAQTNRLQAVRSRGEEYLDQVRAYLKANDAALAKLKKAGILDARLGEIEIRLTRIAGGGQTFTLQMRNLGKKPHTLATHYAPDRDDKPDSPVMRPAYFMLTDEFGNHYPLASITPAYPPQAPLTLAPGARRELRISFGEPYAEAAHKLTLHIDPSLVSSDSKRLRRAPAALVLAKDLIPRTPQPTFTAEPGRRI